MRLRRRPAGNLLKEDTERASEEDREEQPAENEPAIACSADMASGEAALHTAPPVKPIVPPMTVNAISSSQKLTIDRQAKAASASPTSATSDRHENRITASDCAIGSTRASAAVSA